MMDRFPQIPDLESRLSWPPHKVDMVLDTDTYNEIDDQFALVYALLSEERLNVEAVYAAPFHNNRSTSPGDGMQKSYEEIHRVLDLIDQPTEGFAYKGSDRWLPDTTTSVHSPAVEDLVQRALGRTNSPLYVVAIGAITNVVSALLSAPEIREKIVVLWLGGHPLTWHHTREFNLQGDPTASRVLFDCGVPVVLFPCIHVAEALTSTVAELEKFIKDSGPIGAYLFDIFSNYENADLNAPGGSKVIWDLAPVAWLVNQDWVYTEVTSSPILMQDLTWGHDPGRHPIRVAMHINRDGVFGDLFEKLNTDRSTD